MSKDLTVTVEIDIYRVKCQGVWLCPKGEVTFRICTLGCTGRTSKGHPTFPIPYNEKLIFRKTFPDISCFVDLQKQLAKEIFYAELTQWPESSLGVVLAKFKTTLEELLFPKTIQSKNAPRAYVELLLQPERSFPGILSPKIEISTKITVGESVGKHLRKLNSSFPQSQAKRQCKYVPLSQQKLAFYQQKKVCHSVKSTKCLSDHQWDAAHEEVPVSKGFTRTPLLPSSPPPDDMLYDLPDKSDISDNEYNNHIPVCCSVCKKYRTYFNETLPLSFPNLKRGYQHCQQTTENTNCIDSSFHKPYLENSLDISKKCISTVDHLSQLSYDNDEDKSYQEAFYETLEKFYFKLYERAKLKTRAECEFETQSKDESVVCYGINHSTSGDY